VLSRDNLRISFRVHIVWRVDDAKVPLFMERYSTTVAGRSIEKEPDSIVKVAYANFVREPLRTYARDEVQRRNGLEVKDALIAIGDAVRERIRRYAADSPFVIGSVVVGNVQYPDEVANAVSRKLAATQELQRKDTEIEIGLPAERRACRLRRKAQAQAVGRLAGEVGDVDAVRPLAGSGCIDAKARHGRAAVEWRFRHGHGLDLLHSCDRDGRPDPAAPKDHHVV
jgi:regulator of protease activity HflC (stomatin/prohibitin superfamily)